MPNRKHWFPVSHDLLNDPELAAMERELGRYVGPKLIKFWCWILSRLDMTENELKLPDDSLITVARQIIDGYSKTPLKMLVLLERYEWITVTYKPTTNSQQNSSKTTTKQQQNNNKTAAIRVISSPNYWKYHKRPETENFPPILSEPSDPKKKKEKNPKIYLSLGNGHGETEQDAHPPDDPQERLQWFARHKKDPNDYRN